MSVADANASHHAAASSAARRPARNHLALADRDSAVTEQDAALRRNGASMEPWSSDHGDVETLAPAAMGDRSFNGAVVV